MASKGFTLIELSIVLVVIGLVVGGVLVGRDLIRSSEIHSFMSEKQRLDTAVNTFKGKYSCTPGDCPNATTFFGLDPEGCAENVYGSTPKTQTCNGNGNGLIRNLVVVGDDLEREVYWFWQHLSAASLWPGVYRGSYLLSTTDPVKDRIYPGVGIDPKFFYYAGAGGNFQGYLGEEVTSATTLWESAFSGRHGLLTPFEMLNLDKKYDDGRPSTGKMQAMDDEWLEGCTISAAHGPDAPWPDSEYDLSQPARNCLVIFLVGY